MQRSDDEAMDLAYELFLALASDNLSGRKIELFNQYFADDGAIVIEPTADDWYEELGVLIDSEYFMQVAIVLMQAETVVETFARVLIPIDPSCDDIHLIW